jgi:hypothetical protein
LTLPPVCSVLQGTFAAPEALDDYSVVYGQNREDAVSWAWYAGCRVLSAPTRHAVMLVKAGILTREFDVTAPIPATRVPAPDVVVCTAHLPRRTWARVPPLAEDDTCDVLIVHDEHWPGLWFADVYVMNLLEPRTVFSVR